MDRSLAGSAKGELPIVVFSSAAAARVSSKIRGPATFGPVNSCAPNKWRRTMDQETKHEIVVLTVGTLAALPIVTGIGLAMVTGLLAW